jgi:hypothetical protein
MLGLQHSNWENERFTREIAKGGKLFRTIVSQQAQAFIEAYLEMPAPSI